MTDPHQTTLAKARSALQYVYPKRMLSALMFRATRIHHQAFKNWQIRWFIDRYNVAMDQALEPDPNAYPDFNTFFTRPLKAGARPIAGAADEICSPADGTVLELGDMNHQTMLQVKGLELNIDELLGGRSSLTDTFSDGKFATVYLSPRDYHRVHMPASGRLRAMAHIPGELFSVSLRCVHNIPRLLTRNERVVCIFDTNLGPMAVILVGAVFVGSIETLWAGQVVGDNGNEVTWYGYDGSNAIELQKGQEMGRFNMGSTVITLFADQAVQWDQHGRVGTPINMGELLGTKAQSTALTPPTPRC